MSIGRNLLAIAILSTFILPARSLAQTPAAGAQSRKDAPAIAASTDGDSARFTAPGEVLQSRLEIYAATGEQVFDSGALQGGVIEWRAADAQAPLADGTYVCAVTIKDLRGVASRRLGALTLQGGRIALARMNEAELTAAQAQSLSASAAAQKLAASDAAGELTIVREGKERAVTVAAHDGREGQLTSTRGSLTFRTGDLFTGRAREQMRITPDGRVGIGTEEPEAALDGAGTIRARGGIRFADGTLLNSASGLAAAVGAKPGVAAAQGRDGVSPSAYTAGTPGALVKFVSGAKGGLVDSALIDIGGNIGLGTATPTQKFEVVGNVKLSGAGSGLIFADGTTLATAPKSLTGDNIVAAINDLATAQKIGDTRLSPNVARLNGANTWSGANVFSGGLSANGSPVANVGAPVATTDAANKGYVDLNFAAKTYVDSTFALKSYVDSTFALKSYVDSTFPKLNGANAWTGTNVFGAGLSANNSLITNVGNPVNAGDATNKAYTDANFVKFVPGAEQLSVGDANGTAPMINLRGGSTCCSGPGGHTPAWFKVFQNGSFVATGNLGIGVSPMQGKGYRTSWDSYKGAFRSGYADNEWDDATVGFFSWAGGSNSTAEGLYALAFGDTNFARSTSSIAFGSGNEVKGAAGFSAGAGNRVCDTYGVAFGNGAISGGPLINGKCDPDSFNIRGLAAVAIGYKVTADQDHTTALGKFASNNGFTGTFIWSDGSAQQSADTFRNSANNEFAARATGGFRFRTNLAGTTGCNLPAGSGVFNCTSSRATKMNFASVSGVDVLSKVRALPITTWNYISEGDKVRHLGPMAEDFYKAFGLGVGNASIGVQDLASVSLAGVKALEERTADLQVKADEVERLRGEVAALRTANAALEDRLTVIEKSLSRN